MTDNKKVGGFYNTSPAISPQGDKIVFISDRDIFLDLYLMDINKPDDVEKIISSGRTNDFEELNVLFPALTWAPDNKRIAVSTKSGGFDRITIVDVVILLIYYRLDKRIERFELCVLYFKNTLNDCINF